MATNNSSKASSNATLGKTPVPCHEYDSWILPLALNDDNAQFASQVMDIARGTRVIASILCTHLLDLAAIGNGAPAPRVLLNENDTEALARLAVVSLDHLYAMSVHQVDTLNTKAEAGAKA
jgi:hypothetical protein